MLKVKKISTGLKIIFRTLPLFFILTPVSASGQADNMIISGIIDGPLPGGLPKAIEFHVLGDIKDLSRYGFGSANNGGGSDGREFTFPAQTARAGDFIYVAGEETGFIQFFGFSPDFVSSAATINGDDAIELFFDQKVVDVFGEINVSATGRPWEYMDGWAYRRNNSGPDGSTFNSADWRFSGPNALDGAGSNMDAAAPFPIGSYGQDSQPPPSSSCPEPDTFIHAVQGEGLTSPMVGETVTIAGVVVGDFQNNDFADSGDLNGFYVQEEDEDSDGNPLSSEAIFVYAPGSADVSVGDLVHITGRVGEYLTSGGTSSQTQLSGVLRLDVCGTAPLPMITPVNLPVEDSAVFERFEGMHVTFLQALTISEHYNFSRYGEIVLALPPEGEARLYQPTQIVAPGDAAEELLRQNHLRRITLDDGRSIENPDPALHPNGFPFGRSNYFRSGDRIASVVGVMGETFGRYRIQPTRGALFMQDNPRPQTPPDVPGRLKVASFNVLNYFTTFNSRGARNAEEFQRQRAKIITAVAAIDADIVGLIEIENNSGEAIENLISGLNETLGPQTYAYIDTGLIGSDEIKVALIYKPAAVTPAGPFKILDSTVNPQFIDTKNRPALIQTFEEKSSGQRFTIAHNHFKSKGSDCEDLADPDLGDGQGNCNQTRTKAARALVDYLASDPTGSNDPDILIIGDLNAYAMEDPVAAIEAAGYTNMVKHFAKERAYSYVYDGQFGELDHALAGASMALQITGAAVWHINSDEPNIFDYTTRYKKPAQQALFEENAFRSSDHDPVIVGLTLTPESTLNCSAAYPSRKMIWLPNGRMVPVKILGISGSADRPVSITIDNIFQDEPVAGSGAGRRAPDAGGIGTSTAKIRAERSRSENGRVYHISFTATDEGDNTCSGKVTIGVPRFRWKEKSLVDGGPLYDSTQSP